MIKTISPTERLMNGHGILHRIILIYKTAAVKLQEENDFNEMLCSAVANTASVTEKYIINYHQKLEAEYIFPALSKNPQYSDMIDTLLKQHKKAACLTDKILSWKQDDKPEELISYITNFNTMYEPHSAFEDTLIFPEFHRAVPAAQLYDFGQVFTEKETKNIREIGFEYILNQIKQAEISLKIHDLSNFTAECV